MARSAKRSNVASAAEATRALLGDSVADAVSVLVALMRDEGQKPELRMKAAESILDRVCGKSGSAPVGADSLPESVRFEGVLEEWSQ